MHSQSFLFVSQNLSIAGNILPNVIIIINDNKQIQLFILHNNKPSFSDILSFFLFSKEKIILSLQKCKHFYLKL